MKKAFIIYAIFMALALTLAIFLSSLDEGPKHSSRDLLATAEIHGVPPKLMPSVRKAIAALLSTCPKISEAAQDGENFEVWWYAPPGNGWEATGAHLEVEINLTENSLKNLPVGLRDPQWGGHVEMGLTSYPETGAIMEMPLPEWLCDLPVNAGILHSSQRDWTQEKVIKPLPIKRGNF